MIEIQNLHKSFGSNAVLRGIDLTFNGQGITAILGPNGSGKTTLLKCFLGLTSYDSGTITFKNRDIAGQFMYRSEVSHLPQIACFPENLTAQDLIFMMKDLRGGETREDYFIELFGLRPELNKKMTNLSGGNKQKVNLLLSFMFDNPLLILDEPTSGLDPLAIINLKNHLREEKERGKLILVTTHIMSFVEALADHIIFLLDGHIYFDGGLNHLMALHNADTLELAIAKILQSNNSPLRTLKSQAS
jgi:Cu-processing system ATP-binding protein